MEIDINRLVKEYGNMISMIAHRMILNKEIAREAAQEVWYELCKSISSFKGDSEISTWIYTIARRTIGRYAACEKHVKMSEIEYFRSLPEIEYSGGEEAKREWIKERCDWCITALNHCLNNDARLIFIFRENIGLPYRQIGEIMELKESNVRQIYNRSIQKITAFMNDTCPLYNPDGACKCRICKPVYSIDMDIIEERFFWMASDYDDAVRFRDYVINKKTGEKMPNPRSKEQVEPRQQFFACYDAQKHFLYMNDYNKKGFVEQYLSDTLQKEFKISNIYTSLDDFCKNIKTIRGFQYTQVDNVFSRGGTLFSQVGNIWGQDLPSKLQLKISYGDLPIHGGGKGLVDRICRHREEFEDVVIIGCDESGIEQTFDFSSVLKHFLIQPTKDENEHFEPDEVRELLLAKLR